MISRLVRKSSFAATAAMMASCVLSPAQTNLPRPAFDVVSIRPNTADQKITETPPPTPGGRLTWMNASLKQMIAIGYKVRLPDISGGPAWLSSEHYDVSATTGETPVSDERYCLMVQTLLQDRFKLAMHWEVKEIPVFALMVTKDRPKLPAPKSVCVSDSPVALPNSPTVMRCGTFNIMATRMEGVSLTTTQMAEALARIVGRPVIDRTGYPGTFDVHLTYTRESTVFAAPDTASSGVLQADGASVYTALQEQLGLNLESQKGTAAVLVIDHAEKASAN